MESFVLSKGGADDLLRNTERASEQCAYFWVSTIELYIRTRGRTGDTSCTNATGAQGDTRAPFCMRVEYETHVGVCVY